MSDQPSCQPAVCVVGQERLFLFDSAEDGGYYFVGFCLRMVLICAVVDCFNICRCAIGLSLCESDTCNVWMVLLLLGNKTAVKQSFLVK